MNHIDIFILAFLLILSFHYSKCMTFKEWYEKFVRHCKPGEKFPSYKPHMTCTCRYPGVIDNCEYITMREPPDSLPRSVGKRNKDRGRLVTDGNNCATNPLGRWKSKDGCNWCFCAGKESLCTKMECKVKDKTALKRVDSCRNNPTGKIKHEDGCNWCYCMDHNTPICTRMRCIKSGNKQLKKPLMPGACKNKPRGRFRHKDGCNWCYCVGGTDLMCTDMICMKPAKPQIKKLVASKTCATGKGVFLDTDGCNWCECTAVGTAYCTLMLCDDEALGYKAITNKQTLLGHARLTDDDVFNLMANEDKFAKYISLKEKAQHCSVGDEFSVGNGISCSDCTCIEKGVVTCENSDCNNKTDD